jgi:protein ImuB
MRIPSYDDLTPSIPDIGPADVLSAVATVLPASGPVAARAGASASRARELFAAIHDPQSARDPAGPPPGARGPRPAAIDPGPDLLAIARDFSPRLERRAGDTVVLDVAGLQRLLGDAASIAGQLSRAGAPRVAVATSQTAAILLARSRPGVTVAVDDPEGALRSVPLAVLQQFLVDDGRAAASARSLRSPTLAGPMFDVLRRWGLTTLGELAALPAAPLSARLGAGGVGLQRLARGLDDRPLIPDPGTTRFRGSFELEWPIEALEPLSFVFARVLDPLVAGLARADRGAVAIRLDLRLTDRRVHSRALQLPVAMRDPRVLRTLLLLDLESHPPPAAVDVVTIELDPAPARIVQYSLLERAVPAPETLATLMARLAALVGEARCGSAVVLDSHRPDGFAMREGVSGTVTFDHRAPRVRDDGSRAGSPPAVLRRFRPPVAVRVLVDAGRPVRVAIDRRGMPGGTVRQAAGPWRASGGWWEPDRWNRDEWDVALSDGSVCRLFRDREGEQWFLEGVVD